MVPEIIAVTRSIEQTLLSQQRPEKSEKFLMSETLIRFPDKLKINAKQPNWKPLRDDELCFLKHDYKEIIKKRK